MAEDEIRKHTKAIYSVAKSANMNWKHKLKEILLEIIIIIFAVTVSIWLHNWSDKQKDNREEKEFLTGLKTDLESDIEHLYGSKKFYENSLHGITYLLKVAAGVPSNADSVRIYGTIFLSSTNLEPNISRYEALKGSGKFSIIENNQLLSEIINVHQQTFSHIQILNNIFNDNNLNKIQPFIAANLQMDTSFNIINIEQVLRTAQMKFYLLNMHALLSENIINAHTDAINQCKELITNIDEELNERHNN